MHLRAIALTLGGLSLLFLLTACDSGRSYDSSRGDGEYDLRSMSLAVEDVPLGLAEAQLPSNEFDNEQWAALFGADDPAGKQKQLEAQGRLKSYVALFTSSAAAKVVGVTSISTLYTDVAAAEDSETKYACGVPTSDTAPTTELYVPKMGDHSSGFLTEQDNGDGPKAVETTICFRTGRIVHAVQETSVPGVTDVALSVKLAQAMLGHVNDTFDGKLRPSPTPAPTETAPAGGTVPAGGSSPTAASGSPAAGTTPAAGSPTAAGSPAAGTTPAATATP